MNQEDKFWGNAKKIDINLNVTVNFPNPLEIDFLIGKLQEPSLNIKIGPASEQDKGNK